MNLILKHARLRGIAMTEYLIILAIVAVAAIAVVGLFGKQVKSTFTRSNQAMVGVVEEADTGTADQSKSDTIQETMGTFTEKVADQN